MSAFLILFGMAAWGALLFGVGYFLSFSVKKKWIRVLIGVTVAVALFTLPIRDELKGRAEFEALCATGGVYQISPIAEGKKLDLFYGAGSNKKLSGYARPVEEMTIAYTDVSSGEVVARANAYFARGGWLVQNKIIAVTSNSGPLIGRSQCFPGDVPEQATRLHAITRKLVN